MLPENEMPVQEMENADLLAMEANVVQASTGKRFANYLIDLVLFYILAIGIGVVLALTAPGSLDGLNDESAGAGLMDRLITLLFYALYMGTIEAIFKGKSLGKLITKTRAVNEDGSTISAGTAFTRGFSRAVPFCAFSALGSPCYPWQDKWTKTYVVEEASL